MGIPARGRRARRLSDPARRQQHLCERGEPRVRCARVPAGDSGGARQQIHLAGTRITATTSSTPTTPKCRSGVELYAAAVERFGNVSTMIERDDQSRRSPSCAELAQARALCAVPWAGTARRTAAAPRQRPPHGPAAARSGGGLMSGLARVQGDFQDYLLRESDAIGAHVLGSARVPVATRLGIYAGAYRSRLADALQSQLPGAAKLLGEADFTPSPPSTCAPMIRRTSPSATTATRCRSSSPLTRTTWRPRCSPSWRAGNGP